MEERTRCQQHGSVPANLTVVDSDFMQNTDETQDGSDVHVVQGSCISEDKCERHHREFIMVCCTCEDVLVCPLCLTQEHKGHVTNTIGSIASKKRDIFTIMLQNVREQNLPKLEQSLYKVRSRRQ